MDVILVPVLILVLGSNVLLLVLNLGGDGSRRWLADRLGRRGVILAYATWLTFLGGGAFVAVFTDPQATVLWKRVMVLAFGPPMAAVGLGLFAVGLGGGAARTDRLARVLLASDVPREWEPVARPRRPVAAPPPRLPVPIVRAEDRGFLDTLAAAPHDDTARLVYADYLDEQDDPRGPVLRAAVARPDRAVPLPIGVSPVWAAAVRRPPFGVLVPRLTFVGSGPPVDPDALPASWPLGLQAFLLLHNGGVPSRQPSESRLRFFTAAEITRHGWPRDWFDVSTQLAGRQPLVIARAELGEFTGYLVTTGDGLVELVRRGDEVPIVARFTSRLLLTQALDSLPAYLAGLAACDPASAELPGLDDAQ